ncbi:hypothetical protein AB0J81_36035 [Streptomyces bobili]|uniref:hypothetical protein n=1 Tax=Streptomyces bobili TaxID=67280 RepID=UPI00343B0C22
MPEPQWKTELSRDLVLRGYIADTEEERLDVVMPHIEAAYKRGHEAGSSKAGYRLVQENERLRRELALAHQSRREEDPCSTDTATAGGRTPASPTDEPPEGAAP